MGEKIDLTQIRNETIVLIYNHIKIKYMEIAKMQVQHIDKSFALIRINRGDKVFRVSLTPKITENLKLLVKEKEFDDYIFNSKGNRKKHLSHTMIKKIIDNYVVSKLDIEDQVKNINMDDIIESIEMLESRLTCENTENYKRIRVEEFNEYKNLMNLKNQLKKGNIILN